MFFGFSISRPSGRYESLVPDSPKTAEVRCSGWAGRMAFGTGDRWCIPLEVAISESFAQ